MIERDFVWLYEKYYVDSSIYSLIFHGCFIVIFAILIDYSSEREHIKKNEKNAHRYSRKQLIKTMHLARKAEYSNKKKPLILILHINLKM